MCLLMMTFVVRDSDEQRRERVRLKGFWHKSLHLAEAGCAILLEHHSVLQEGHSEIVVWRFYWHNYRCGWLNHWSCHYTQSPTSPCPLPRSQCRGESQGLGMGGVSAFQPSNLLLAFSDILPQTEGVWESS